MATIVRLHVTLARRFPRHGAAACLQGWKAQDLTPALCDRRWQSTGANPKRFHKKPKKTQTSAYVADSDWESAVKAFEHDVRVHVDRTTYTSSDIHAIITLCANHKRHREAQSVLLKAKNAGIPIPSATQAVMCALQARKGNVDAAFETLEELLTKAKRNGENVTRFHDALVTVLKEQNDWQNVRRVIQQMHQFQIEPPLRVFRVLMISAARARKKDVLLKTIEFVRAKFTDGASIDLPTLSAMSQSLTEVGETRKVMDIYHEMDQDWLETHGTTVLFNHFVLAALRHGRLQKAIEIFDRMKRSQQFPPDDFTFATCILEFEKRGNWAEVIHFFNQMQEREIKGISTHTINALSCAAVIRAIHNQEGRTKHQMKRDMSVVLERLPRVAITQFGHSASLVDALDDNRYHQEALAVFGRMVDSGVIKTPWLRQDGYEIDLHSFSRGLGKCAVVYAFQQMRDRPSLRKIDDMRIVTGVGKRSKEFLQPVMPTEVSQLLIRQFRPLIRPIPHPTNPGVLLIRRKTLQAWLEEGAVIRHYDP
ncbi:hypothetical protein Poli38472_003887 [Pythium oligandrum]|uniref:Pentatricopeptide repeat-containing protein n=1 Tax=Pythium oligandrum TaxID=41045 RepID=A0A8K1FNQ5_PYTOL|nr:hypothetical protein Poli38472_003887 [Pythium oligandrum]|eukprot:TMW66122.1 hypothetical protein Poli38472_003887 [Pythium oligandrum]